MNQITNKNELERQANRIPGASQATGIEQSRAVAEVQAAVAVAQRFPRFEAQAIRSALEACSQMTVADRAFYSFPRGGENVNGPSIGLAVELARCWGNIDYGIMELERDDAAGHTEMLAFAWDLQTNTKSRQTFIVPHRRDTRNGPKALTDMRDIYENNANNGARRLRECIFRVLPAYLREQAVQRCHETLQKGEGERPLAERVARTISSFEKAGVSLERLEKRQGPSGQWTPVELANLHVAYVSIQRGETTIDEAFPPETKGDTAKTAERVKQLAKKEPATEERPETPEQDGERAAQQDHHTPAEEAAASNATPSDQSDAEETAKAIDGPLDDQTAGSQDGEEGEGEPWQLRKAEIIEQIDACKAVPDLTKLRGEVNNDIEAMPEEAAKSVKRAFSDMNKALQAREQSE